MEDFNSYAKRGGDGKKPKEEKLPGDMTSLFKMLANKYNGASEDEMIAAITAEAERSRARGTLSDGEIDRFAAMLAPMLSKEQSAKLNKVIKKLKSMPH